MADVLESDIAEIPNVAADNAIAEFSTYEEYLDSQITPLDLYYLEVWWPIVLQEKHFK